MKATNQMMKRNGVEVVGYYSPDDQSTRDILQDYGFDLIISCLSWGYHYPVQTYLDLAYHSMAEGGAIILDVRVGDDKRWKIPVETMFQSWEVLARGNKREKIMIRGPR